MIDNDRISREEEIFTKHRSSTVGRVNGRSSLCAQVGAAVWGAWFTVENSTMAKIRTFTAGNGNAERLLPQDLIGDLRMNGVELFRFACGSGQISRVELDILVFNFQFRRRKAGWFHFDDGFPPVDSAVFHRKQHVGCLLSRFQIQIDADDRHPAFLNPNKWDFLLLPIDINGFHSGLVRKRQLDHASLACSKNGQCQQ